MPTVPPVDVDDLKAHLNMSPGASGDDPELSMHLEAATETCEGEIGPILHRTVSEQVAVRHCVVFVSTPRLVSVQSLVSVGGTIYDPDGLDIDASGLISRHSGFPRGRYDVDYTSGMFATAGVVPAAVKLAVLIVAGHTWETQRGRQGRAAFIPGEVGTPADQSELIMSGFSLPSRAIELLKPYKLTPVVA